MLDTLRHLFWPCCPSSCGRRGHPATEPLLPAGASPAAPRPATLAPPASAPSPGRQGAGEPSARPRPPAPGSVGRDRVHVAPLAPWRDVDGVWRATLNLNLTHLGPETLAAGWRLSVDVPGALALGDSWNWGAEMTRPGLVEGATGKFWQTLAPGESANVGSILRLDGPQVSVAAVRVDDVGCVLDG